MSGMINRILNVLITAAILVVAGLVSAGFGSVLVALYLIGYKYIMHKKVPYFEIFK